ncbi:hypothetical protein C8Q77DRAFT_1144583 [Trametes polyzona]|nr:hypothetical protein C8Q77DRAFT_1144583 [Trametes polyzona]
MLGIFTTCVRSCGLHHLSLYHHNPLLATWLKGRAPFSCSTYSPLGWRCGISSL